MSQIQDTQNRNLSEYQAVGCPIFKGLLKSRDLLDHSIIRHSGPVYALFVPFSLDFEQSSETVT